MALKAKINEMIESEIEKDSGQINEVQNESIIDTANNFLKSKQADGIPVTEAFRKLFILNYIESKNLEQSWRKTRGN